MKLVEIVFLLILTGLIVVAANMVGYKADAFLSLQGVLVMVLIGAISFAIVRIPFLKNFPVVALATGVAIYASSAWFPWHKEVIAITNKVDFMAIATPTLAYAGLSIGKDLAIFQQLSWRIIPVALAVIAGTVVCAAVIAQWALHLEGAI